MQQNVIQIKLERIEQLFNSLDPTPFVGRDLDPAAHDFIEGWADELPREGTFKIALQISEAGDLVKAQSRAHDAVRNYYSARATVQQHKLHRLFRNGRMSLVVGLTFLVACHILSEFLEARFTAETLPSLIAHGLIIAGWVAMWRPLEIFLYDWWPLRRRLNLLKRLAAAEVRVVSVAPSPIDSGQLAEPHTKL